MNHLEQSIVAGIAGVSVALGQAASTTPDWGPILEKGGFMAAFAFAFYWILNTLAKKLDSLEASIKDLADSIKTKP